MSEPPWPAEASVGPGFIATRMALQRVATHVLARRRFAVTGRFGLRATPGGFGTPAFGPPDAVEVIRVAGATLVHEVGGDARRISLSGATLREVSTAVGANLVTPFEAGHDTPGLGDVDEPLPIDDTAAVTLGDWFDLGWRILDQVSATGSGPSAIQLWPEHFDAGCSVPIGPGAEDRCNLGVSPGDGFCQEPYLYVGPWGTNRPGDQRWWNAPFGAVLLRRDVGSVGEGVAFMFHRLELLTQP